MTASKAIRAFLVAFAAFLLAAGAAAPAMAQEPPVLVTQGGNEMGAQARHFNEVRSWQILYQCPMLGCNEGAVYPGQHLGEICHMDVNGFRWALVYNRANGHTGFVNRDNLIHKRSLGPCDNVGTEGSVSGRVDLYQCPQFECNKGSADRGHLLRVECYVDVNNGYYWVWLYNRANGHEGFLPVLDRPRLEVC
ncbi:hypothetical protein LFM09_35150 [Lentzea alba]|uniref:hypothetical protein n=1 Tax=Lentzea alba TaxID=2714351 RepID=UPI0039BF75EF